LQRLQHLDHDWRFIFPIRRTDHTINQDRLLSARSVTLSCIHLYFIFTTLFLTLKLVKICKIYEYFMDLTLVQSSCHGISLFGFGRSSNGVGHWGRRHIVYPALSFGNYSSPFSCSSDLLTFKNIPCTPPYSRSLAKRDNTCAFPIRSALLYLATSPICSRLTVPTSDPSEICLPLIAVFRIYQRSDLIVEASRS
jgi:hypothetical protein